MQESSDKLLSLIIPVFNEESVIEAFLASLRTHLDGIPFQKEFILVDDGSHDGTWRILCALQAQFDGLTLIRFSRNFGKEAAIKAGLERCTGDAAVILDADLQHPPSLIQEMTRVWQGGDVDIIDGVKVFPSAGGRSEQATSNFFNTLFYRLTGYDMAGASDYKLLDRRVIDTLKNMDDYNLFFRGTTLWLGFEHRKLEFEVPARPGGDSKWSLMSRLGLAITAITSFTSAPLHLMTLVGLLSLVFALVLGLQTLYMKFNGAAVEGFTTVIILLLFFGSMITLGLGIIGAYLSKIHDEVRGRPRYIVDTIRSATESGEDSE